MKKEDAFNSSDEKLTREKYIDPTLRKRGWIEKYIKIEVNSVKVEQAKEEAIPE